MSQRHVDVTMKSRIVLEVVSKEAKEKRKRSNKYHLNRE